MKKTVAWLAVASAAALCSCAPVPVQESSRDVIAMDTVVSVRAFGENSDSAVDSAVERLEQLERLFSVTREDSDIFHVNSFGNAEVSDDTAKLVSAALGMCESTGGALDITIYPVLREWGFTTSEFRVPSDSDISEALSHTGYGRVTVSGNTVSVPEGYMLDLGACAKGYAGAELAETLKQCGISSAIINLGGNVQVLGTKPDGTDWTVGIADPDSPNELIGTVSVHDKAVVTSGGYQRYFIGDDGKKYIHIIDPTTGRPAESGLLSVTVIGDDGMVCDALSTALFVMGRERAEEYRRAHGDFGMVMITDNGIICVTRDISAGFVNKTERSVEIIDE